MKLYTKEMFLIAAEKCEVSMIDAKHIMQYIDEYTNPIELPSDEEIKNYWSYGYGGDSGSAIFGAKWLRDKIKGGEQ